MEEVQKASFDDFACQAGRWDGMFAGDSAEHWAQLQLLGLETIWSFKHDASALIGKRRGYEERIRSLEVSVLVMWQLKLVDYEHGLLDNGLEK